MAHEKEISYPLLERMKKPIIHCMAYSILFSLLHTQVKLRNVPVLNKRTTELQTSCSCRGYVRAPTLGYCTYVKHS